MNIQSIQQTPSSVSLSFQTADPVTIKREDRQLYQGTGPSFTDDGLEPGTVYTYRFEADGEKQLIVQTATAVELSDKNQDIPLQERVITTVLSKQSVAIAWEPIRGVSEYEVRRNGEYAGTVTQPAFTDPHIDPAEETVYEIKGVRPIEPGDEEETTERSPVAKLVRLLKTKTSEDDLLAEAFILIKDIGRLHDHFSGTHEPEPEKSIIMRYTTFLEDEWIENPNVLSNMRLFTGDGRTFDPDSESYRTRADIRVENKQVSLKRSVGLSKGYTLQKQLVEEDRASDEGIVIKQVESDEKKVSFLLEHAVSNPLMPSPDIEYHTFASFYKGGRIDISGEHDEAPHHEVYVKKGAGSWKPVHRSETRGLERLTPLTAKRFWRYMSM